MAERDQLDDRSLVERILGGDRDQFALLVSRYEKRVINYAYRITHRYEEAHDLAQEIFVKVYLALDRYDPKYQFSTWLFRIAQNSAIDALRKKSISEVPLARPVEEDSSGQGPRVRRRRRLSPYRALKNKQLGAAIDTAVDGLPSDYRELIQLRHFAELSYEEIATMKRLPLGTVKNKLFRARNLLKDALGIIRGTAMTCEEYLDDPAGERESSRRPVRVCRLIAARSRRGRRRFAVIPVDLDALPLAEWEGASYRTWPLVAAGSGVHPHSLHRALPGRRFVPSAWSRPGRDLGRYVF